MKTCFVLGLVFLLVGAVQGGIWRNLYGSWSDSGNSWTGTTDKKFHYGPAKLWTQPIHSSEYTITSQVYTSVTTGCGHVFKYKTGSTMTKSDVTKSWGYFLWSNTYLYITSDKKESSPRINYAFSGNKWYNLKTVVNGTRVKIYINNKFVRQVVMKGPGADSRRNNYVGIWCHSSTSEQGRGFALRDDSNGCLANNGGCSHKCVHTRGNPICSCPDPELSLAQDRKTCVAQGVLVKCRDSYMSITIPKSLLRGMDRQHLRLINTSCLATETGSHFMLKTPLTGCGTSRRLIGNSTVYKNKVLEIPIKSGGVITRVREIEIPFSCFYSKYGVVSAVGFKPLNRKLVFSERGTGRFNLSLDLYPDQRYVSAYTARDFPVAVILRKRLYFQVKVKSSDADLSVLAQDCYGTPTQDRTAKLKTFLIRNGCPTDRTVRFHTAPNNKTKRFSLEAFKFISNHPLAFIHCHVRVCNGSDTTSRCARGCESRGRGKRDAEHRDTYPLTQGPLVLGNSDDVINKEGKENPTAKNLSGGAAAVMLIASLACLLGVAIMVNTKSRGQPAKYSPLTTVPN